VKRAALATGLLGLALFTGLLVWQGTTVVLTALGTAGWGLLLVVLLHGVIVVLDAIAWRPLFPEPRPSLRTLVWTRWIGESVNGLLPVAQIGGDVAKARLMTREGVTGSVAAATVIADMTVAAATQMLFGLMGVWLLLTHLDSADALPVLLLGLGILTLAIGLFWLVQQHGLFGFLARRLAPFIGRAWIGLIGGAESLDRELAAMYGRRRGVLVSGAWHLVAWILGAGEVWLVMWCVGTPVTLTEALLLESLGQAVRGAAFAVPGALGIQEGAYIFLGSLLGIDPGIALALSLAKRVRELSLGVPGLVTWQIVEARRLRRQAPTPAARLHPVDAANRGVTACRP